VEWENIKQNRSKEGDDEDEVDAEYDPFLKSPAAMEMTPRATQIKDRHASKNLMS
jgi:hypothetical protein